MTDKTAVSRFIRPRNARNSLAQSLLDVAGTVPPSRVRRSNTPQDCARAIARKATLKASATAGALALPPGALGWVTIAPELYAVWKMQAQMVSDIAACHGRHTQLRREEMLYCLFQHTAAGAFRDIVIQIGERYIVRQTPLSALYAIANKIALRLAQRSITRAGMRWLPLAGAVVVTGFVLLDTRRVAATAMALFGSHVQYEGEVIDADAAPVPVAKKKKSSTAPRKPRQRRSGATDS